MSKEQDRIDRLLRLAEGPEDDGSIPSLGIRERTWREKQLLEIIEKQTTLTTTSKICQLADMAKATALKYLAVLEEAKLIRCEHIGPTKLWKIVKRCPKCDTIMEETSIFQCLECNNK